MKIELKMRSQWHAINNKSKQKKKHHQNELKGINKQILITLNINGFISPIKMAQTSRLDGEADNLSAATPKLQYQTPPRIKESKKIYSKQMDLRSKPGKSY